MTRSVCDEEERVCDEEAEGRDRSDQDNRLDVNL